MESLEKKPRQARGKGKKVMTFIAIVVSVIAALMLVGAALRATLYRSARERIEPYGRLVEVAGGRMHLRSMGSGGDTIVLLPGMGVALPSAEFGPLMRKLAERHAVVCVEYFGVGFSSGTGRPRSSEAYVEETRTALAAAGFKPPYVLMPHSISSVFAEYFAETHPDEVEAIISLDGTSTAYYEKMPGFVKALLPIAKFQQAIGLTAIAASLATDRKSLRAEGYSDAEIHDVIAFAGFAVNDTLVAEIAESSEFIREAKELPYPASVPYFKVIAKKTWETRNPQLKMSPEDYQLRHLDRIGPVARYEILDGSHFIWLGNAERIAAITDEVLASTRGAGQPAK